MYYILVDKNGIDPLNIQIYKILGRDKDLVKVCGCRYSFINGILKFEEKRFYSQNYLNLKGDYYYEDFNALQFDDLNMESLSLDGFENFPIDQIDVSVFESTDENVFKYLE